ncbi:MAG: ArsR family transcriptional regulator [Chloroflexi bacterium]|nr:MAG: ArsR family transcriptional regulator [Chloroflexota bacterium]MBL1192803.1 ArsR family transcriptional regulator [Chloroflexota bacterium]NOH10097.1 winged helix-turn-helix transcriptional regulator [Chloroflexota bacterium]
MSQNTEQLFGALSEPHRVGIVELLAAHGQMNSTAISQEFPITAAAVSQHLKVLREAGILVMEKQAQKRLYQINPQAFDELESWAKQMKATWESRFTQLDELLTKEEGA